ncbi:substrate-binding periplasmic protein [Pseudomonas matsuisoli]|uniref:ABC transporter substrate-binding protein n=1 Tax=Pseudomonas matsuisoli TaxID=1515666 RepID=A0A917PY12_9PSED|nr:transporter substrate-binding domain-containing protein [Pseudomonas matsuisoli]GGJ98403.1 hypothetical protein GCM10009304_25390 [Pseudomonas matsuisoli]
MRPNRLPMLCLLAVFIAGPTHAERILAVTESSSYTYLENGKVSGPATRVVEATLQKAGLTDYEVTLYPWARAYDMALREPNVLIYVIARTPEREHLFKWVGKMDDTRPQFYKLADREDIHVGALEEASHYRVGVIRDDMRHQYLEQQGFERLVLSAQNSDSFRKLVNGQVDLLPLPEREARRLAVEANVDFSILQPVFSLDALSTQLYLAYSVSTSDAIVERTRQAFEQVRKALPAP